MLPKLMQTNTKQPASRAAGQDDVTTSWGEEVKHWHRLARLGLLPTGLGNAFLVDQQPAAKGPCDERKRGD